MKADGFSFQLQSIFKRILDVLFASIALILWMPVLLITSVIIKLDSRGPVFFRHRRIGKDGHPFDLYKFRTMTAGGDDSAYMKYLQELIESEKNGVSQALPYRKMNGDSRVTRVGSFLRCFYIDEIPQLINVIKGVMSLVGPRPHVQFEVDNYTPWQRRRLTVKPGATGLWQVAGKADCTFSELLALDLEYIDRWSLWLDIKIMFMTVAIMFRGGEKFWTRTAKLIPTKRRSVVHTRLTRDNSSQSSEEGKFPIVSEPSSPKRVSTLK